MGVIMDHRSLQFLGIHRFRNLDILEDVSMINRLIYFYLILLVYKIIFKF